MKVKIGKLYKSQSGDTVEIIGLSNHRGEFVATIRGAAHPMFYNNEGIPVDQSTGASIQNSPFKLLEELS